MKKEYMTKEWRNILPSDPSINWWISGPLDIRGTWFEKKIEISKLAIIYKNTIYDKTSWILYIMKKLVLHKGIGIYLAIFLNFSLRSHHFDMDKHIFNIPVDVLLHTGCPGCYPSTKRAELARVWFVTGTQAEFR